MKCDQLLPWSAAALAHSDSQGNVDRLRTISWGDCQPADMSLVGLLAQSKREDFVLVAESVFSMQIALRARNACHGARSSHMNRTICCVLAFQAALPLL